MKKDFAVIFDLDGTLLNTDLLIQKSFEHVFKRYKPDYQISDEEHLSFLGPTLKETFSRYFPDDMIDELIEYYREYNHKHHQDYVTIYPHIRETLKTLKQKGYPLAVVTTKYRQAAYIGLDLFDLTNYFDMVLGMNDVQHVKPHPEGIVKVMQTLRLHYNVKPVRCFVNVRSRLRWLTLQASNSKLVRKYTLSANRKQVV